MTERRARYTINQALNDELAFQMDEAGVNYLREFRPHKFTVRFRWDFMIYSNSIEIKEPREFTYYGNQYLVEVNGGIWTKGGHSTGRGIQRDYRKANLAALNGWRQLTFTADDVHSGEALKTIMQALGMETK